MDVLEGTQRPLKSDFHRLTPESMEPFFQSILFILENKWECT